VAVLHCAGERPYVIDLSSETPGRRAHLLVVRPAERKVVSQAHPFLVRSISTHHRASPAHLFSEVIATLGLILVIFSAARTRRATTTAAAVGAYIGAAYFFTSSTSFANPAITIGRMFSNTSPGSRPPPCPGSWSQLVGGAVAIVVIRILYPDVTAEDAAQAVLPHPDGRPAQATADRT
jgi:glycerol uptake facilitator-like aquaporin